MKKFLSLLLIACIVCSALSGCSNFKEGSETDKNITVVFIPKLTGNAFFESANDGAQEYAAKHGFSVRYEGSLKAEVSEQISIVEKAVEDKADAICISALDAAALDEVMKKAINAGIKVTTWNSDVSGDARIIMVSQGTPDQLGKMLVEMGAKSLTGRGKNPAAEEIKYAWHYSQSSVTDQNSWQAAGEKYIRSTYPTWVNVAPENYYSEQIKEKAAEVGQTIFAEHPDIDLIICNDSTTLPGQAEAARILGFSSGDVTITGFSSPNPMREYCESGIVER